MSFTNLSRTFALSFCLTMMALPFAPTAFAQDATTEAPLRAPKRRQPRL